MGEDDNVEREARGSSFVLLKKKKKVEGTFMTLDLPSLEALWK